MRTARAARTSLALAFVAGLWLLTAPAGLGASSSGSVTAAAAAAPAPIASASPAPAASPDVIGSGDPRSNGQGPGLVGSPLAILIGVVLLGVVAAGGTLLYLRLTRER